MRLIALSLLPSLVHCFILQCYHGKSAIRSTTQLPLQLANKQSSEDLVVALSKVKILEHLVRDLRSLLSDYESKMDYSKQEKQKLRDSLNEQQRSNSALQGRLTMLSEDIVYLNSQLSRQRKLSMASNTENDRLQEGIQAKDKEVADLHEELKRGQNHYRKAIQMQRQKYANLKIEKNSLIEQLVSTNSTLVDMETSSESIQIAEAAVKAAERRKQEAQSQVDTLKVQVSGLQDEKQRLLLRVDELETESVSVATSEPSMREVEMRKEIDELKRQIAVFQTTEAARARIDKLAAKAQLDKKREIYKQKMRLFHQTITPEEAQGKSIWSRVKKLSLRKRP